MSMSGFAWYAQGGGFDCTPASFPLFLFMPPVKQLSLCAYALAVVLAAAALTVIVMGAVVIEFPLWYDI